MLEILLLAHGGPGSLDEVPAFLDRLWGGRPVSDTLRDEVRERYRFIGGSSPLPGISRSVANRLHETCGLPVRVGMLHWHPFLEEVVSEIVADGASGTLVICLVPHFSQASVGEYRRRTTAAANGKGLTFDFVESWHSLPPYIQGLADSIIVSCEHLGMEPGTWPHVVFSAHSLPKATLLPDDPYESQLLETAESVATRLGLPTGGWTLAYQSGGVSGNGWLGPSVDEVIQGLAERGVDRVVLCPCGFVIDQVEILYNLDVSAAQKAADVGVTLARTPLLNDGSALIDTLALLVERWRG